MEVYNISEFSDLIGDDWYFDPVAELDRLDVEAELQFDSEED